MASARSVQFAAYFGASRFNDGYLKTAVEYYQELHLPMPHIFKEYCSRLDCLRAAQRQDAVDMKEAQKILSAANLARKNAALLEILEAEDLDELEDFGRFQEEQSVDEVDMEDMVQLDRNEGENQSSVGSYQGGFIRYEDESPSQRKKKKNK